MRFARGLLPAVTCMLVASCATVSAPEPPAAEGFSIVGRVAVRNGSDAASGRITWRHSASDDDVLISTPLGQGLAEITRRDRVFTLVTNNGERYSASDPERLTEQVLGYALPLGGLADWVQGRPQPGVQAAAKYDGDRLVELRQDGWLIDYSGATERPPNRIRLARGDLDIRLVIDEWRLAPK